jgi:DNA-binding protein WhiA
VKREITTAQVEDCCLKAELYGIIKLRGSLSISNKSFFFTFTTTSNPTARRILYLVKKVYGLRVEILKKEQVQLDKKSLFYLVVQNLTKEILIDLDILNEDYSFNNTVSEKIINKDCCKASVLRAAFLTRGSINDPSKNKYHLEIVTNNEEDAKFLISIIDVFSLTAKMLVRPKGYVVYLKKAENIADFLRLIGASNSLFAFEDIRIKKDLNNYVNRIMNCDVSNQEKALSTASKQLDNIAYLEKNYGIMNLTPRLVDAIVLRTSHPEHSLSELSYASFESIGRFISKSGLSHCFKDIDNLVQEIKKSKVQQ